MSNWTIIPLQNDRQARFTKLECDDVEKSITVYYRIEKIVSDKIIIEEIKYYKLINHLFDRWDTSELGIAIRVALEEGITSDLAENNIN
jgi:hypothetical protein